MYGPPSYKTQRRLFGGTQDIGQVFSALDSDSRSMEHGLASWRVQTSQWTSCCFISTVAGWCTGMVYTQTIYSHDIPAGTGHSLVSPTRLRRWPVSTIMKAQILRSAGGRFQTRPAGPSHTGFCISGVEGWPPAGHTAATVTFAADVEVIASTPARSTSDLLKPVRRFSLPLPQYVGHVRHVGH